MKKTALLIFGFLFIGGILWAGESEILKIYGGFETGGKLKGWEKSEVSPLISYNVTEKNPREGNYCARIKVKNARYQYPSIEINPHLKWDTSKSCKLSFSIKALQKNIGSLMFVQVKGEGNDSKEYKWNYIIHQGWKKGFNQILNNSKEWNSKNTISILGGKNQSPTTYNEWLSGLQHDVYYVIIKKWVDFDVDLKKSFIVKGAPKKPTEINLIGLSISNVVDPTTDWCVDNIRMTIVDDADI